MMKISKNNLLLTSKVLPNMAFFSSKTKSKTISAENGGAHKTVDFTYPNKALFVGEGNFSYTRLFIEGDKNKNKEGEGFLPQNIYTTSLDSHDEVVKKHRGAKQNLQILARMNVQIHHNVDARFLMHHPVIGPQIFQKIYFNFPESSVKPGDLKLSQFLLFKFFLNCSRLLSETGTVHMAFRTSSDYKEWKLPLIAYSCGFDKPSSVTLDMSKDILYKPVKGFGKNPDAPFETKESVKYTFKRKPAGGGQIIKGGLGQITNAAGVGNLLGKDDTRLTKGEEFVDMVKTGLMDPLRIDLVDAASVSSLMETEAFVDKLPKPASEGASSGCVGGMGGFGSLDY